MEQDDFIRERFAVGVSVRELDGKVELIFDDLERLDSDPRPRWRKWAYFTYLTVEPTSFEESELSEEQYAAIGRSVTMRLNALPAVAAKKAESSIGDGGGVPDDPG